MRFMQIENKEVNRMADIIKEIINLFIYPITHEVEAHGKLLTDEEKQDLLEREKRRYERELIKIFEKFDRL